MKKLCLLLLLACGAVMLDAQGAVALGSSSENADVNGDGFVNSVDVTAIYNYILNGDETYVSTCDVNGDGYINSVDVTYVYNVILGYGNEDEHESVDLGLPSGTLWATMNVGASAPEEFGDYYAWGETEGKSNYGWDTYKWCNGNWNKLTKYCTNGTYGYEGFVDGKTELDPEDDAATVNWGSGWCMPTKEQQDELRDECTWVWTTSNGVKGQLLTSKHNGATLFLPAAGYRFSGELYSTGTLGYYWSRTLYGTRQYNAYYSFFHSNGTDNTYGDRYDGFCVRAVRVSQE